MEGGKKGEYALKLHKNVYGQKHAGRVWYKYLTKKLTEEFVFERSQVDECVFYRGKKIYVLYTDDYILAGPDQEDIEQVIRYLRKANLEVTYEGNIEDFLGVNIERKEGKIKLSQPHLIEQVIKDLGLNHDKVLSKPIPAASSKILFAHKESQPFNNSFNYRSVIIKLKYLEKSFRPDISYIVHQCVRLSTDHRKEHGQALRWLGKYLKDNINEGTTIQPEKGRGLEVWVDDDFAGNWNRLENEDRDTARSRHGYFILYESFTILKKSQLQT